MYVPKNNTHRLVLIALLVALNIVLSRFLSISAWNFKIGFAFVPVVIAAITMGPIGGGVVAGLGDLIGALMFPIGAFFPGFTLTAFLTGFVYGICLHKKQSTFRILAACLTTAIFGTLVLNTLWVSIIYGVPMEVLLATRWLQAALMLFVEIVTIHAIISYVPILHKTV